MQIEARPFLRWAGGKRQLLPELLRRVPAAYGTYYEPFLGGGALFFALKPARAVLSDANEELMAAYAAVCDNPEAIVRELRTMEDAHSRDPRGTYDYVRSAGSSGHSLVYNAARMIYLNKTCFNGLYRVNKSGLFNVPMGKFARPPVICAAANLRACSDVLKRGVELRTVDFKAVLGRPKEGDFVYLDPPYVPRSDSSNFTAFTKEGFGATDQADLAKIARRLKEDGVHILLSNSGTKEVRDLYPEPFFKVEEVKGRRNINSHWEGRCALVEYLIS